MYSRDMGRGNSREGGGRHCSTNPEGRPASLTPCRARAAGGVCAGAPCRVSPFTRGRTHAKPLPPPSPYQPDKSRPSPRTKWTRRSAARRFVMAGAAVQAKDSLAALMAMWKAPVEDGALPAPPPLPPPRTKWTRRVPHPVLIGHAASL